MGGFEERGEVMCVAKSGLVAHGLFTCPRIMAGATAHTTSLLPCYDPSLRRLLFALSPESLRTPTQIANSLRAVRQLAHACCRVAR